MKVYKCDGPNCGKETDNTSNWLTMGSNNNSLFLENNLPDRALNSMQKYRDIHFCSKRCLIFKLFKNEYI